MINMLEKPSSGKNHASGLKLGLHESALCTEQNGVATTFVAKSPILMEWNNFFIHHDNISRIASPSSLVLEVLDPVNNHIQISQIF